MNQARILQTKPHQTLLYWVVYDAVFVKCVIGFLLLFFLLHPTVSVFAAEETDETEVELPEPELIAEVAEVTAVDEADDSLEQVVDGDEDLSDASATEVEVESEQKTASSTPSTPKTTTKASSTKEVSTIATSSSVSTTDPAVVATSTIDTSSGTSSNNNSSSSATSTAAFEQPKTEPVLDTEPIETPVIKTGEDDVIATSTDSVEIVYVQNTSTEANKLSFDINDCVSVGDGSFYCNATTENELSATRDLLYAALDAEGDQEIYIQLEGELKQLTDNRYDDASPEYDETSQTVVWHRLIDGRYQIVVYDLLNQEETVITTGSENNMEPQHENGITVWQRWVDNNWEIMLYDGRIERQLTHSAAQDVAPDIRQGFVIWSISSANSQKTLGVYEIATGELTTIDDPEGGQVTNPRFVLMYDTTFSNGDIITKGFNPDTGKVEPLSAIPGQIPTNIPPPDQTGETRALIQNKSSTGRDDADELLDNLVREYKTNKSTSSATSTAVGISAVDTTASTSTATSTDLIVEDPVLSATTTLPLTDYDLIVEPFSATTSAQVDNTGTTTNLVE